MLRTTTSFALCWGVIFGCVLRRAEGARGTVIWLTNGGGATAQNTLNANTPFVTSFKGTNDVTITKLAGSLTGNALDTFPPASATCNNPAYISSFVGAATNGTGDGTLGRMAMLQPQAGTTLQFDFSIPFDADDRLLIADTDGNEQYTITAFTAAGGVYTQEPLTGWVHQPFTGMAGQLPNANWPVWNATGAGPLAGTLTASTAGNLLEPLDVFTPDRAISRVVIQSLGNLLGTPGIQFWAPFDEPTLMPTSSPTSSPSRAPTSSPTSTPTPAPTPDCSGLREVLVKARASKAVNRQKGVLQYRASVRFAKTPAGSPTGLLSLAVTLPPGVTVVSSSSSLKGTNATNDGSVITWRAFTIPKSRTVYFRLKARAAEAQGASIAIATTVYRWDGSSNTCPTTATPLQVRLK